MMNAITFGAGVQIASKCVILYSIVQCVDTGLRQGEPSMGRAE